MNMENIVDNFEKVTVKQEFDPSYYNETDFSIYDTGNTLTKDQDLLEYRNSYLPNAEAHFIKDKLIENCVIKSSAQSKNNTKTNRQCENGKYVEGINNKFVENKNIFVTARDEPTYAELLAPVVIYLKEEIVDYYDKDENGEPEDHRNPQLNIRNVASNGRQAAVPSDYRRRQRHCQHCNKSFSAPSQLTRHMNVHNGERPFQCKFCEKRCTMQSNLKAHVQIHTGNKSHVCSVCNKAFIQKASLIRHTRTHTGEKPYTCTECAKAFTEQSNLVAHIRLHTGVKPYACSKCNAAFKHSGNLTKHIQTHSGKKPYQCPTCHKSFATSSYLTKHKRIHTHIHGNT